MNYENPMVNTGDRPYFYTDEREELKPKPPTCNDQCGEYIDDASIAKYGPMVRYRRWEMDGKLSQGSHASCAANSLLGGWQGLFESGAFFDAEDCSYEEIVEIVERAFAPELSYEQKLWAVTR